MIFLTLVILFVIFFVSFMVMKYCVAPSSTNGSKMPRASARLRRLLGIPSQSAEENPREQYSFGPGKFMKRYEAVKTHVPNAHRVMDVPENGLITPECASQMVLVGTRIFYPTLNIHAQFRHGRHSDTLCKRLERSRPIHPPTSLERMSRMILVKSITACSKHRVALCFHQMSNHDTEHIHATNSSTIVQLDTRCTDGSSTTYTNIDGTVMSMSYPHHSGVDLLVGVCDSNNNGRVVTLRNKLSRKRPKTELRELNSDELSAPPAFGTGPGAAFGHRIVTTPTGILIVASIQYLHVYQWHQWSTRTPSGNVRLTRDGGWTYQTSVWVGGATGTHHVCASATGSLLFVSDPTYQDNKGRVVAFIRQVSHNGSVGYISHPLAEGLMHQRMLGLHLSYCNGFLIYSYCEIDRTSRKVCTKIAQRDMYVVGPEQLYELHIPTSVLDTYPMSMFVCAGLRNPRTCHAIIESELGDLIYLRSE